MGSGKHEAHGNSRRLLLGLLGKSLQLLVSELPPLSCHHLRPETEASTRKARAEGQSQVLIVSFEILKPEALEARPTYRLRPGYIICRV